MPELPEVETVRRVALTLVQGRTIQAVRVSESFPCVLESESGIDPVPTLVGSTVLDIHRRGKYLLFELDSGLWMVVHLRMTGRLLVVDRHEPAVRFEHLALELDTGVDIRFGDQRKFGRVSVVSPEFIERLSARLGIEPLTDEFTGVWLEARLARRPGKIKSILLDQHLIAGLGNIYVDEALFQAGIHPLTPGNTIDIDAANRLVSTIRTVLTTGIENQGTTFSTFENPYGEAGTNAAYLQVYGKGRRAEPCPVCGTPLEHGVIGGRGSTWCPACQPLPSNPLPGQDTPGILTRDDRGVGKGILVRGRSRK